MVSEYFLVNINSVQDLEDLLSNLKAAIPEGARNVKVKLYSDECNNFDLYLEFMPPETPEEKEKRLLKEEVAKKKKIAKLEKQLKELKGG